MAGRPLAGNGSGGSYPARLRVTRGRLAGAPRDGRLPIPFHTAAAGLAAGLAPGLAPGLAAGPRGRRRGRVSPRTDSTPISHCSPVYRGARRVDAVRAKTRRLDAAVALCSAAGRQAGMCFTNQGAAMAAGAAWLDRGHVFQNPATCILLSKTQSSSPPSPPCTATNVHGN